jgi:tetrapyrrole methylase family protein/MazG family protein
MATITLVGLGPGTPNLVTRAAWNILEKATEGIYTTTPEHPILAMVPFSVVRPLSANEPETAAAVLVEHAAVGKRVICGLRGHPNDHRLATILANTESVEVQVVPGVSIADVVRGALAGIGAGDNLQMVNANALPLPPAAVLPTDGQERQGGEIGQEGQEHASQGEDGAWCEMQNIGRYIPPTLPYPFNPSHPTLIWTDDHIALDTIQTLLLQRYPSKYAIRLMHMQQSGEVERGKEVAICELHTLDPLTSSTALYIPKLPLEQNLRSMEGLEWVVMRLLGPGGCPWDRKQTHKSLRAGMLEETYEVLEAIDEGDMQALSEELGDFLAQSLIQSEMARQAGHFALADVVEHIAAKLIRRHPHIFGTTQVNDVGEVLTNWEAIKAQELSKKGKTRKSVLDGIPAHLPALSYTQKVCQRTMNAGHDWDSVEEAWEKFREEVEEVHEVSLRYLENPSDEQVKAHLAEEFGDMLFAAVHLAQWHSVDAEHVLREGNRKYQRRFNAIERMLEEQGKHITQVPSTTVSELWQVVKTNERDEHHQHEGCSDQSEQI